jgi:hypothetical protein
MQELFRGRGRRITNKGRYGRTASSLYCSEILPDAREIVWQKLYYTHATQTIVKNVYFMAVTETARVRITRRIVIK